MDLEHPNTRGPGIYGGWVEALHDATGGAGVFLLVLGGVMGGGSSVKFSPADMAIAPNILRKIADQMEADAKRVIEDGNAP